MVLAITCMLLNYSTVQLCAQTYYSVVRERTQQPNTYALERD